MIDITDNFGIIFERLNLSKNLAIFLDFDGTISPIVPLPENAYLPEETKIILEKISKVWPISIVTGRDLKTIKGKVNLKCVSYGASHGLEWEILGEYGSSEISKKILEKISLIREKILLLKNQYENLIIEDKKLAFAFHYQLLNNDQKVSAKEEAEKILSNFSKDKDLKIFRDRETVEILPNSNVNKGGISKKILDILEEKTGEIFLPIYIGDSSTDEDAFKMFKEGITIKVGYAKDSSAKYFFRYRDRVDVFIKWLSEIAKNV